MGLDGDLQMKFKNVTLLTSELEETLQFYEETLECPVQVLDHDSFIVQIGETQLHFQKSEEINQPFYHFAIDIPYNHFYDMKQHYQNILFLLMEDGQHTTYFESFVAHSLYFNDPSGNIVELIARVSNMTDDPEFSRISEVGFVCNELDDVYQALINHHLTTHEARSFSPEGLNFMCDSDDECYILLTPENKKWIFSDKASTAFPIAIETQDFKLTYDDKHQWSLVSL